MQRKPEFGKAESHEKAWGREWWVVNIPLYCGKILEFNKGASFSMHYHVKKEETWCVLQGAFEMEYYDLATAEIMTVKLNVGDTVHLQPSVPHKLRNIGDHIGMIFEVSTQHFNDDSYRIGKGDSQK